MNNKKEPIMMTPVKLIPACLFALALAVAGWLETTSFAKSREASASVVHTATGTGFEVKFYQPDGRMEMYIQGQAEPITVGLGAGYTREGRYVPRKITGFTADPVIGKDKITFALQLEDNVRAEVQYQWAANTVTAGYRVVEPEGIAYKAGYSLGASTPAFYSYVESLNLYVNDKHPKGVKLEKVAKQFEGATLIVVPRKGESFTNGFADVVHLQGQDIGVSSNVVIKGVFGTKTVTFHGSTDHGEYFGLYIPSNRLPAERVAVTFIKRPPTTPALPSEQTLQITVK